MAGDGETSASPRLERSTLELESEPGIRVFVTRVRPAGPARGAVVLTHGAGSPASAVWDLPNGYSVMAALAERGFDAFTVDVRGFGGSTSPPALLGPADAAPPAVRAHDVLPDVDAVVERARAEVGGGPVDLVGWSWGALVAGLYASRHPDEVRRLVLFAPVFDRKWPSRHRTEEAWREEPRALHMKWLDPEREDEAIRRAYVDRLFRFADGDVLRIPNGPYRDIYGPDAPIWSPEAVRAETLVVRGTEDRASLRVHARALYDRLIHAKRRVYRELEGAGHFAFRTRAGAPALRAAIVSFLDRPVTAEARAKPAERTSTAGADGAEGR
jgi:alpha-beta hydrolase superfamily lysophospholipase